MKSLLLLLILSLTLVFRAQAQPLPSAAAAVAPALTKNGPYTITAYGGDYRVWERLVEEPGPGGKSTLQKRRFVQCATGLDVFRDNKWSPAEETIEPIPGGAVAQKGQHRVLFLNDLATAGAIDMEAPDGKRLVSSIICISYWDSATGSNVLLGEVKSCLGRVSGNQVAFIDALTQVRADVVYTYRLASLEQDLILREKLPDASAFGLHPDSTKLLIYSEFYNPPAAVIHRRAQLPTDDPEAEVDELDFGATRLVRGQAFGIGGHGAKRTIPVTKRWQIIGGRRFLIEEVPLSEVQVELDALPAHEGAAVKATNALGRTASLKLKLPPALPQAQVRSTNEMLLAQAVATAPGFAVDWQAQVGSTNDFTFEGDTTYFISDAFYVNGALTIEGASVIKYTNAPGQYSKAFVQANGALVCRTAPWRPAVLTSQDNDAVGERLPWSTGTPTNDTAVGLRLNGAQTIHGLRLANLWVGVSSWQSVVAEDCQFVSCAVGIDIYGPPVTLRNILFSRVGTPLHGSVSGITITGEQVTADQFDCFAKMGNYGATVQSISLINCLFTQGTNLCWSPLNTPTTNYNAVVLLPTATDVYQCAGAANYYLADNSPYRHAGNTNLTTNTLALIRARTTWPPLVLSNVTVTSDVTFSPQVERDTGVPDLGFHYVPIDYLTADVIFTNAALTVTPGTVVGFGAAAGVWLYSQSGITCEGTATAPNRFTHLACVQEQSARWPINTSGSSAVVPYRCGTTGGPGRYRFTQFTALAPMGYHLLHRDQWTHNPLSIRDCQFWNSLLQFNGTSTGEVAAITVNNNLFVGTQLESDESNDARQEGGELRNNTFFRGRVDIFAYAYDPPQWNIQDNLFCNTTELALYASHDFNAYVGNNTLWLDPPMTTNEMVLTNFTFASSWLGDYYQGSTNLVNRGSRTNAALAGLYHYTTQTNQVKEANTRLDVGFHYVACTNGVPVDTDGDGVPDYLEDANGNGAFDSGEADWQAYDSASGLSGTRRLQVFTPLK